MLSKCGMMGDYDRYHKTAVVIMCMSSVSVLLLGISSVLIVHTAKNHKHHTLLHATIYQEKIQTVWQHIMTLQTDFGVRTRRYFVGASNSQAEGGSIKLCQNCFRLLCPRGLPGRSGPSGADGIPGDSGNSGESGFNGIDIQMSPPPPFPCVVCSEGPLGPRGYQGERGEDGLRGSKGNFGEQGPEGPEGVLGDFGSRGPSGPKGISGSGGVIGSPGIGGFGIKGPKGLPGNRGVKGLPGRQGRPANSVGPIGEYGPVGEVGERGNPGPRGPQGPWGPSGFLGYPAEYCQSDCGVRHVIAPRNEPANFDHHGYRVQNPERFGYSDQYEWLPYWNTEERYENPASPAPVVDNYRSDVEDTSAIKSISLLETSELTIEDEDLEADIAVVGPPSAIPPSDISQFNNQLSFSKDDAKLAIDSSIPLVPAEVPSEKESNPNESISQVPANFKSSGDPGVLTFSLGSVPDPPAPRLARNDDKSVEARVIDLSTHRSNDPNNVTFLNDFEHIGDILTHASPRFEFSTPPPFVPSRIRNWLSTWKNVARFGRANKA